MTLPLVKDFPTRLSEFVTFIKERFPNSVQKETTFISVVGDPRRQFIEDIQNIIVEIEGHASIDTYAKKLYLTGNQRELMKLKSLVDLFLTVEQVRKGVDPRYDGFFAALLNEEDGLVKFPDNIKIITWNYDFHIEISLCTLLSSLIPYQLEERIGIYPAFSRSTFSAYSIVKLNGTAMGWLTGTNAFIKRPFDTTLLKSKVTDEYLTRLLEEPLQEYFKNIYLNNSGESRIPTILYSWEREEIAQNARSYAMQIMDRTDYLVIIGYSFPTFNRSVDGAMLRALKPFTPIFVQSKRESLGAARQRIEALLGSHPHGLVTTIPETDEFYIPYEFNG